VDPHEDDYALDTAIHSLDTEDAVTGQSAFEGYYFVRNSEITFIPEFLSGRCP
jgi:hypothetical protein